MSRRQWTRGPVNFGAPGNVYRYWKVKFEREGFEGVSFELRAIMGVILPKCMKCHRDAVLIETSRAHVGWVHQHTRSGFCWAGGSIEVQPWTTKRLRVA